MASTTAFHSIIVGTQLIERDRRFSRYYGQSQGGMWERERTGVGVPLVLMF